MKTGAPPASSLDELIHIERACADLIMRYGHALDEWDYELMQGLFAEDAVWEVSGGPTFIGVAAIMAFWKEALAEQRPSIGRHIFNNIRIWRTGTHEARATSHVTMYRYNPSQPITSLAPILIGDALFEFLRTADQWRFRRYALNSVTVEGYAHGKN